MYQLERKGIFRKTTRLTSTEPLSTADFEALAAQTGQQPYLAKKVGFVAARRAETVESVDSFNDGHETTNAANVGDWIVTNITPGGNVLRDAKGKLNQYVITAETFERLYEKAGRETELGPLFRPRGTVLALKLPGSFDIMGPWKQRQRGKAGYLIRSGDEVYGIERSVFHRTYDLRGPGAQKLSRPGPKRMLALDGGGVRGILTLAFLEQIELELRKQHNNPSLVLSDYFDMIGGTSVGAILATQLALGEPVENVKRLFIDWCPHIFRRPALWRKFGWILVPRFKARVLEEKLKERLGDLRMGSPELKCGLCIVTKRVDSGSPWVLTNNPRSKFWLEHDERVVANKEYRLADVVRASTAAPLAFQAHKIQIALGANEKPGLFVDGGVSPFNNPALQMFMVAGIAGYGLDWPLGEDNIFIVSVGTGRYRFESKGQGIAVTQAASALQSMIGDGEALTLTLLQWMSASTNSWQINSEIGDLSEDFLGRGEGLAKPLLQFRRYDAPLEGKWLKDQLKIDMPSVELEVLRDFTNPDNLKRLYEIGSEAARMQVKTEHFRREFLIEAPMQ